MLLCVCVCVCVCTHRERVAECCCQVQCRECPHETPPLFSEGHIEPLAAPGVAHLQQGKHGGVKEERKKGKEGGKREREGRERERERERKIKRSD